MALQSIGIAEHDRGDLHVRVEIGAIERQRLLQRVFARESPGGRLIGAEPVVMQPRLAELAGRIAVWIGNVLDRKSTRLNSSHLVISYAVFCLKKKTPRSSVSS